MKIFTDRNVKDIEDFFLYAEKRMYKKISEISFDCFFTKERLTLDEAKKQPVNPVTRGTKWGYKYEYGWFFAKVVIPPECENKRVVFKADLGECVAFVNGEVYGALDKEHKEITLSESAVSGDIYDIALEVYAGHGPLYTTRTVLPGEECKEFADNILQKETKDGEIGIFDDKLFSLLMDVKVLFNLMQNIDENTMRYKMIAKGLKKMCTVIDIEAKDEEFFKQMDIAKEILKPLLLCENGTSAPVAYSVGHSHLDLEWVWTVNETRRKTARTIGNQLRLMEEYPEYKYVQSQPWILETVKNEYPELYKKVKDAVARGQFIPEGATWLEMDTNIPSGESLVRQFIFGKKFIKEEFDRDSKILWLPDVFGISAALPQIMKGCDVDYLYNAKVGWSYANNIPHYKGTFIWRGIDGTEVLMNNNESYCGAMLPESNLNTWKNASNTENVPDILVTFGHGDGGGGATREHLELANSQQNLEGAPKIKMCDPLDFYRDVELKYDVDMVYEGELWFSEHKGTFTTQANTKRYNRKCEVALREAEFWGAFLKKTENKEKTDYLWKKVLFNQFHDIIPGTAIQGTYERAEKEYEAILKETNAITDEVLENFIHKNENSITVFNSLPWSRWEETELPDNATGVKNANGEIYAAYKSNGKVFAQIFCEGCSIESFELLYDGKTKEETEKSDLILENEYIKAEFDQEGYLVNLCDKSNKEYIASKSNIFRIYRNHPNSFDAWDIDIDYKEKEISSDGKSKAEIISKSEDKTVLRITKEILDSKIVQDVVLRKNSKRLDFETTIEWNETHKMLKVDFDTNIRTNELVSEIQFGHIKRPTHENFDQDIAQYEKCQHKWSALAETDRRFAILNDCKYGISADRGKMSLTLLTSSQTPMIDADKGVHKFTYSVCVDSPEQIIKEAYSLNHPVVVKKGRAEYRKLFKVSDDGIVIETVKLAEDGSDDIIVRLYDATNSAKDFTLDCGFPVRCAQITNMLEKNLSHAEADGNTIKLSIKASEVITLRIKGE